MRIVSPASRSGEAPRSSRQARPS